jgi:hypothetical protein
VEGRLCSTYNRVEADTKHGNPITKALLDVVSYAYSKGYHGLKIYKNDTLFEKVPIIEFKEILNSMLNENLYEKDKFEIIIMPAREKIESKEKIDQILEKFHDNKLTGGHPGIKRTLEKIKAKYVWKNMTRDITKYVKKCVECQKNKSGVKTREKLRLTPTPQKPMDIVQVDTIGPFVKMNENFEYAITLSDELSKYLIYSSLYWLSFMHIKLKNK